MQQRRSGCTWAGGKKDIQLFAGNSFDYKNYSGFFIETIFMIAAIIAAACAIEPSVSISSAPGQCRILKSAPKIFIKRPTKKMKKGHFR